jgi:hypothetical protein
MSRMIVVLGIFAVVWIVLAVGAFIFDIGRAGYTIPNNRSLTSKILSSDELPITGLAFLITSAIFFWFG